MPTTAARCSSRSSIAATTVASPNTSAQSAMPTFAARIVDDFRSLVDHLKEQRGPVVRQREVAQLVDHQEPGTCEEPHAGGPSAFQGGLWHLAASSAAVVK